MAALQYVDFPGYSAVLFRRTYADLAKPGALLDRAYEWLGSTAAVWNDNKKRWTFPRGATLSFGHLEHDNDIFQQQSTEYQFCGFDELTHFTEKQYTYLFSRLRRSVTSDVPIRMRAAANPGGVGHEWVKQRFIVQGAAYGHVFVPAKLADNPHVDRDEYLQALAELDPVTRQQLVNGDWDVVLRGNMFNRSWCEVVPVGPERALRVRYWDKAATDAGPGTDPDWTAGVKIAYTGTRWVIEDVHRFRGDPGIVERRIDAVTSSDGKGVIVGMEQEGGSAGKSDIYHWQQKLHPRGFSVVGIHPTGAKEQRAMIVSAAMSAHQVDIVEGPWNNDYWQELEPFPTPKLHDDQVDATSGGFELIVQLLQKMGHGKPQVGGTRPHSDYVSR